jgi:hypothetical protein
VLHRPTSQTCPDQIALSPVIAFAVSDGKPESGARVLVLTHRTELHLGNIG